MSFVMMKQNQIWSMVIEYNTEICRVRSRTFPTVSNTGNHLEDLVNLYYCGKVITINIIYSFIVEM